MKLLTSSLLLLLSASCFALTTQRLRLEHLENPQGVETTQPRFSWRVTSPATGAAQSAYQILVASSFEKLAADQGDLWDSGKVKSSNTLLINYNGKPLASGQAAFWKVRTWNEKDIPSPWSETATWSMGLLKPEDWSAQWISFKDTTPLHTDRSKLHLPPARHYRKDFESKSPVVRATLYSSALGLGDLYLNGQRVTENYFEPGWSDYVQRAYYRTHDVTKLVRSGGNRLGAIVADGWYSGYVGYSLLVGYGPNKNGRNHYGKTPALLAQLVLEHADGTRQVVATDDSWETSGDGPVREADFLMGENFDARLNDFNWCVHPTSIVQAPGPSAPWKWEKAVPASENGSLKAPFFEAGGKSREVELGFQKPAKLAAYTAQPIVVTQELKAQKITEPKPGVYLFDFGQNFAGNIRLSVKGEAGTKLTLRYGEMLNKDGTLMTENLRKARATDTYVCAGGAANSKAGHGIETWTPRFTYHGFQYVEVSGLKQKPDLSLLTGLVIHNDTPLTSTFACSDEVMTQFWKNTVWTQRANFVEVPTDCPQRDERLGWMGDAQVYVRTATYNADTAAFYTKWLDDLSESQRPEGMYPDYAPYPMAHGQPGQTWGVAWTDAGIIVPWTAWKVYGDTRLIRRQWNSMSRFMDWRAKRSPDFKGREGGNPWGDWLNVGETTPVAFIDACYYALDAACMAEMAFNIGLDEEGGKYVRLQLALNEQFQKDYLNEDGTLKVNTQTAHALALGTGVLPPEMRQKTGDALAKLIEAKGFSMATGFLGTRSLLSSLTLAGHHDLAVRLFQSRRFPSWGYEVANGANTVWERWDSYTKEHGFNGLDGKQNSAMNSFSHYAFGAVMGWAFRDLAGIDMAEPGYRGIVLRPRPPTSRSNPENKPIDWVKATYDSPSGIISVSWKVEGNKFVYEATIPANAAARLILPAKNTASVLRDGQPVPAAEIQEAPGSAVLELSSGTHHLTSELP